jgi:hypothetical protein
MKRLSLNNTQDIVCNSLHIVQGNVTTNILALITAGGDIDALIANLLVNQTFLDAISNESDGYTKTESDTKYSTQTYLTNQLALKLDSSIISNYYTISQVVDLLNGKVNVSTLGNYYLKTEINDIFQSYYTTGQSDINYYYKTVLYTKTEIDNLLTDKTDTTSLSNYYLKTEIDTTLNSYYLSSQIDTTFGSYYNKTSTDTLLDLKVDVTYIVNYTNTFDLLNLLNLKVNNTVLASYYLKTETDTLLTNKVNTSTLTSYYTSAYIATNYYNKNYVDALIATYDTSTEVDTKISAIDISSKQDTLTDNYQGDGSNSFQIFNDSSNIIRRLLPTSPLTMVIPNNNGSPEDDNIRIGINTSSFSTSYEAPYLPSEQWVRIGYLLTQSNSGRVCKFEIVSNSTSLGYVEQSLTVYFSTHTSGIVGADGSNFKGRCSGFFRNIGLQFKAQQDNSIGSMYSFYVFLPPGHKSSVIVSANPNDSYTSEMYYGVGIPSDWDTTNSVNCFSEEIYTASNVDGQLATKQSTLTTASGNGVPLIVGNIVKNVSVSSPLVMTQHVLDGVSSDLRLDIALDTNLPFGLDNVYNPHNTHNTNTGNWAWFGFPIENAGIEHYALLQPSSGSTYLNAWAGESLNLRIGNSSKMWFTSSLASIVGNLNVSGSVTSNSDQSLKDNIVDVNKTECMSLLNNINAKTYERNDMNGEKRVGFIANQFDDLLGINMRNIVGTTTINNDDDGKNGTEIKTLDYSRLTSILWTICQNLNDRIKILEGNAI